MEIKDLTPSLLWDLFDQITKIPRPSKKEQKIVEFLIKFAQKYNLDIQKDNADNIIIHKQATFGKENLKTVILQSHMDMVCEKNNDIQFDFENDSIQTYIENDWVKAKGTTLGADDGIGMAAVLAILASDNIEHGNIIALFTTDEETGLTGASALNSDLLQGDILLNLDSEKWGKFCIGCAGGKTTVGTFTYQLEPIPYNYFWFEIKISGLRGGHSGLDIHKGLGNANKILARYLHRLSQASPIVLSEINGGSLHNAIAREASAIVGIPFSQKEKANIYLNLLDAELLEELPLKDHGIKTSIQSIDTPTHIIDTETASNLIRTLYILPHGAIAWSLEISDTVETSTNLASVKMKQNHTIEIVTNHRSFTISARDNIADIVSATFLSGKAKTKTFGEYPGWKPNPNSAILHIAKQILENMFDEQPHIVSVHAGLECGLFLEKKPKLDMISCGPTIEAVHSPEERLKISTVEKWWLFLIELLKSIPSKNT